MAAWVSQLMQGDKHAFPMRVRLGWSAAVGFALSLAVLFGAQSAHALGQRGHSFGGSFGEAVGLSGPSAVAVNEASGEAYVLDSANNRVVRFGPAPEHAFIEAWGYGVGDGAKVFEKCTSGCRPGLAGFAKGQFNQPVAIAIDNTAGSPSRGDVYVIANGTATKGVIDKFSPTGVLGTRLIGKKEEKEEVEGMIAGVAVSPNGTVWVERESETEEFVIERFDSRVKNKLIGTPALLEIPLLEGPRPVRPGFAVDSAEHIYVTYEPGGKDLEELQAAPEPICAGHQCFVAELEIVAGEAEPVALELDEENSTGVAVDSSTGARGNVYLDNVSSVAAFTPSLSFIQRFGAEQLEHGEGLAVDAATGEVLVADAAAGHIDTYPPSPPGAPLVKPESVSAAKVTSSSAELRATIDPSGADTHYRFQYGTDSCAAGACQDAPLPPGSDIGSGFGDQKASTEIGGLSASTTYHVRVVAENQFAEAPAAVISEEITFTTASLSLGPVLPDGRGWELVSPADKHGASVEPIQREGDLIEGANNGRAVTYTTTAPVGENEPEGNRDPEQPQIISTRGPAGWSSQVITTPNELARGIRSGLPREYSWFSADLGLSLVEPPSGVPLSTPPQEETIYLRHNLTCPTAPASCYEPIVNTANDTAGSNFGGALQFSGATPDLSHVVLFSTRPLTAGASGSGLYEWSAGDGQLQLVSVLPDGSRPALGVSLGGTSITEMRSTAISTDGARVVWRTNPTGSGHLYMRDTQKRETTAVDEPDAGVPAAKLEPAPDFKTASADGSRIFFGDARRLTPTSTAPENHPFEPPQDLYVFEPGKPAGERLTDLTPDLNPGEGAAVLGEPVASSDGTFVYFVANGVLAAGARPGNCREEAPSGESCSLYVLHFDEKAGEWQKPHFIARLSGEDAPDWGRPAGGQYVLKALTSRTSPDGNYLAFMSNMPLTGYNNVDEKSGVRDEEVFLYNYAGGSLLCPSCNPSGAQPVGAHDIEESGEGVGLVIDRAEVWGEEFEGVDHWLAAAVPGWTDISLFRSLYQSRYLLDDGRLFFDSSDALVPRALNRGTMDVYEYEPKGVGGCQVENTKGGCVALISSGEAQHESAFLDASESGDDVFFLTNVKLAPQDADTNYDMYDARVCEVPGADPCAKPSQSVPPCSSEACKPAPSVPPSFGAPASATLSGGGNLKSGVLSSQATQTTTKATTKPPTRAQRLASALKTCRKRYKPGKRRAACERQARKKYGTHASKAKHASASPTTSRNRGR
jgi:hypothetical protein